MKQIVVAMARTIWVFDLALFNPKGLNLWPVCEWLIKEYRFASFPKNVLDFNAEKGLAFQAAPFINSKGENVLVALSVFNNGLVAEASSSTDDSEAFLEKVTTEISKTFGLTVPSGFGRAYVSQLEVELRLSLAAINPKLGEIAEFLSGSVQPYDGKPRNYNFGALQFWTEDVNPATSPAYFRLERKVGAPFSRNHYFSQSALKTHEHRALLERIETMFQG